ncbi:methyl-accepting chemotaxis protein [Roseateles koreensis]|uniref:Methyl-accepting chemotaxis protein n=1 Tax=Roseateles koreensis TaxID=2987526 RepID=A0ABT5KM84_9BURK|nr:methyl-accepting chemotaxis protein [Roseateles koreensis]MDC8783961.1 methyl-accepting chemotaxis protein [Roseateles koreensis]
MLRRLKIRARLILAFAVILILSGLLVGLGTFGLTTARKALYGITHRLIPVSNITVAARTHLIESKLAATNVIGSIFDDAGIKRAEGDWERSMVGLDKAMDDFGAAATTPQAHENLSKFRALMVDYRARVQPVIAKMKAFKYPDTQEAFADLKKADTAYEPARQMLSGIEADIVKRGAEVADQVDGFVNTMVLGLLISFAVCAAFGAALAWRLSRSIVLPLRAATRFSEGMAQGDLSGHLTIEGQDETADMMHALLAMQGALAQIVGQVRESAESIQVASAEVAGGNLDLSTRTEQTASNLQQTASAMSELTGTVGHSAESAVMAKQLAGEAAQAAERGGDVVTRVVSTMGEISGSSKKIADIIGVIDGIAFQTNILALNAAVEAARAGEQGRGFAVVAGEVRQLAQRSAEAAREIKGLIGASVERVEAGTTLVGNAGNTMQDIVGSVKRVADMIGEISSATSAQSLGIGRVNTTITDLDQMTQQNAALVEESAAAAQSLKEQAIRLSGLVSSFKL